MSGERNRSSVAFTLSRIPPWGREPARSTLLINIRFLCLAPARPQRAKVKEMSEGQKPVRWDRTGSQTWVIQNRPFVHDQNQEACDQTMRHTQVPEERSSEHQPIIVSHANKVPRLEPIRGAKRAPPPPYRHQNNSQPFLGRRGVGTGNKCAWVKRIGSPNRSAI